MRQAAETLRTWWQFGLFIESLTTACLLVIGELRGVVHPDHVWQTRLGAVAAAMVAAACLRWGDVRRHLR